MIKYLTFFLVLFSMLLTLNVSANSCGYKPYPNFGCKIGRCVNGAWEQVCGESNSTDSPTLHEIANPKTADIAGAVEARQRRLDAAEDRQRQHAAEDRLQQQADEDKLQENTKYKSQANAVNKPQSSLMEFEQLRKTDKLATDYIMLGFVKALNAANSMLELKKQKPLYCQPRQLTLLIENYVQIYNANLESRRIELEKLETIDAVDVLLFSLIETFPCPSSGK